jgi:hypothetical protein
MVRQLAALTRAAGVIGLAAACAPVARLEPRRVPESPTASSSRVTQLISYATEPGRDASEPIPVSPADTIWTIERGIYAGMRVSLSIDAAVAHRNGEHFWRFPPGGKGNGGVVGWKSTRFPVPVAFRHGASSAGISAADSAAFWTVLDEMGSDMGMPLFRPATVGDTDPIDIIIVDVKPMARADGVSRTSWSSSGDLFDVRVTFRNGGALRDPHVVAHEMMHALGFGHTTSWVSVVNPGDASRRGRLTPEDVAYAELAMHSRETRERADMRRLIAMALKRDSHRYIDELDFRCDPDTPRVRDSDGAANDRLVPADLLGDVLGCAVISPTGVMR